MVEVTKCFYSVALASAITVADNGHEAPDLAIAHTYITTTYTVSLLFNVKGRMCMCIAAATVFFYILCHETFLQSIRFELKNKY